MNEEQLRSLVERARGGDREAFTALYEATYPEVYRTIRAMIRSEDLALDVQQEVYVQAFTHLKQLNDPGKLLPWLRSIAVNQSRMHLRKQTPVLFTELEREDGSEVPELTDLRPGSLPEEALERKETARLMRETLDTLTDSQRLLVGMYYYEQLPVTKIAEDLNLSPGTVKTQLSRSRKKLETRIRELEAKGVKLFGLAPMPFLLGLLKSLVPAAEGEKKALAGALSEAGLSTETAAVHVGRRFFETALGKAVLGVAAVAAIGVGVAGWNWYQNSRHGNVGDTRIPETVRLAYEDSDEDLPTEPDTDFETDTEYVTLPDSEEDLPTETDPTEPTEPTEPETETEEPTEPPIQPTDPPAAQPTDPPVTQPTEPTSEPTDPAVPSDSSDPAPSEAPPETSAYQEPEFLRWYWDGKETAPSMDLYDVLNTKNTYILWVEVLGDAVPVVSADKAGVIQLQYAGRMASNDEIRRHFWYVTYKGSGTAKLTCEYDGISRGTLTIDNPAHPLACKSVNWGLWANQSFLNGDPMPELDPRMVTDKLVGDQDTLTVCIQKDVSESADISVYTDNPGVLNVSYKDRVGTSCWYEYNYLYTVKVVGCGTAHVLIALGGEVVDTITITAPEYPKSVLRFKWFFDKSGPYAVGDTNMIDMLIEGNEIPRVYTDNSDVVRLQIANVHGSDTGGRVRQYHITTTMIGVGTANIYCEYEGEILYVFPVTVGTE